MLNFEPTPVRLLDGTPAIIPAPTGGETLPEHRQALMAAAAIIGPTLSREGWLNLPELTARVGEIAAAEPSRYGLIINDEGTVSSVRVQSPDTVVSLRRTGTLRVASSLLYDMLQAWLEQSSQAS
jgi:hypothetical protein